MTIIYVFFGSGFVSAQRWGDRFFVSAGRFAVGGPHDNTTERNRKHVQELSDARPLTSIEKRRKIRFIRDIAYAALKRLENRCGI
jgi:hypothetical protein